MDVCFTQFAQLACKVNNFFANNDQNYNKNY